MEQRPLGVLVHGAGWVSTQHLASYQNNLRTRVVAISSRSRESAATRAREAGLEDAQLFDDLNEALALESVDLVSICTPQHVHCDNVLAAAQAGKHMVIEKPAGISAEELTKMRDAVRKAGVRTIVSFVLRWNPLFAAIKRLIARGALGQVFSVEADYLSYAGDWWGGFEEGRRRDRGVSAMLVAGCHAADALRWFAAAGEEQAADPVEVFAFRGGARGDSTRQYDPIHNRWREGGRLEFDGLESLLVRFDNGVVGRVSVNFDYVGPYRFPLRVFGDRGTIIDNRLWSHEFPEQHDWIELPCIRPDSADVTHHPFQGQIDHFVDCVIEGRESYCNLEDAIKTHEIALAALRCYEQRRPVTLPLVPR